MRFERGRIEFFTQLVKCLTTVQTATVNIRGENCDAGLEKRAQDAYLVEQIRDRYPRGFLAM
jgi:hypothetical protein